MLETVRLKFKYCYGIDAMEHEFDFSNNNMPTLIYAANGTMKTSFARTLRDYCEDRAPRDIFFPERSSSFDIVNHEGTAIQRDSIFVIDPIDAKYQSKKISTLLASENLKLRYDAIYESISEKTDVLFKSLKKQSGVNREIEAAFTEAFKVKASDLLVALGRLEREVNEGANEQFSGLKYKTLFSDRVLDFLNSGDVKKLIEDYTKTYEQLLDRSKYFRKGVFNHSNAETIAKNLKANGWFEGGHSVNLKHAGERNEITTQAQLVEAIETEKQMILTDPQLAEMFQKVDSALTTAELKAYRDYLIEHPYIVPELADVDSFKQKIWIAYLVKNAALYADLIEEYDSSKEEIREIIADAEKEQTHWERVLDVFNDRFSVPFEVQIENKGDAVLNAAAPQIAFYFTGRDGDGPKKTNRDQLDQGLSSGEKRALYILNIIFEIEARKHSNAETLVVLDDIADSFDYKNKYAIVEYLNDMREDANFKLIILTHNYDFYRTVRGRLSVYGESKLLSSRANGALQLIRDNLSENPFADWRKKLSDPVFLVASIPFVRNLAEYSGNDALFDSLTSLLHVKLNTMNIVVEELYDMYKDMLAENSFQDFRLALEGRVFDIIESVCQGIVHSVDGDLSLEQKIALSVGIRLAAEQFLCDAIGDPDYTASITRNQTIKLIRRYQTMDGCDAEVLKVMKRVSLMTPENIHLNSFMFEPILDMSGHHLKSLYQELCQCRDGVAYA